MTVGAITFLRILKKGYSELPVTEFRGLRYAFESGCIHNYERLEMRLPRELSDLEEPYYVLSAPVWMQWPMMATVLFAPPIGFGWLYFQYSSVGLEIYHYFIAAILLGVISALFGPGFFRQWARFAVDRNGMHFGDAQYRFTFVPWNDVGEVLVEHLSGGRKGVRIELRVTDEVWRKIYPLYVMYGIPEAKKFPIQDTGHSAERIKEHIDRIRRVVPTVSGNFF